MQCCDIRPSKSAPRTTVFKIFTSECAFRHSGVQCCDMCFSPQRRAMLRHPTFEKCSEDYSFLTFFLPTVLFATAACIFSTSELQKALPPRGVLSIFTSKCAFRHRGVQFFDRRTSKSAPTPSVFEHFHFQMCFSPQRRAFFQHLNFKKCSHHEVF